MRCAEPCLWAALTLILKLLRKTLPLGSADPSFALIAQILLAGGADSNGNGLAYSTRMSNIGPGLQPTLVQESMGQARIEGCATNLPDGTVFLTSGAANGARPFM